MEEIKNLSDIVDNGLCIGCGLCQSIAGKNLISINMTEKGRLEPKELKPLSNTIFNKIKNTCPGVVVEGLPEKEIIKNSNKDIIWGEYHSIFYAWSTNSKIRYQSSTGGLLNGLSLYLIESKKVKFICHTSSVPDKPMRNYSKFSYTKDDLLNCDSRSRYGPSSPLDKFHKALSLNEPFAFVGKPCDVSAIRQLSKIDDRVDKLCKYLLTIVCGGFAEFTKSQDFIESFDVKEDELSVFRYRGFGNPGKMYIKTKNGKEHDKEYNSFWGEESTWRVPFRCKICPDAIGESADLAALDTWEGGSPRGEDEGFNAAIVRTQKGLDLIKDAVNAGYIETGNDVSIDEINDFQPHQVKKKKAVYSRFQGLINKKLPSIRTERLRIRQLSELNSEEFNLKEEQGITKRINKI